jgi:hypothetical protein
MRPDMTEIAVAFRNLQARLKLRFGNLVHSRDQVFNTECKTRATVLGLFLAS